MHPSALHISALVKFLLQPFGLGSLCSHFTDREIESQGSSVTGERDTKERWLLFVVLFLLRGLSMRAQAGRTQGFLLQSLFRRAEMTGVRYSAG